MLFVRIQSNTNSTFSILRIVKGEILHANNSLLTQKTPPVKKSYMRRNKAADHEEVIGSWLVRPAQQWDKYVSQNMSTSLFY